MLGEVSKGDCENGVMLRRKSKRLPEPSSEYSLSTIHSIDKSSTFSTINDHDNPTMSMGTNDLNAAGCVFYGFFSCVVCEETV